MATPEGKVKKSLYSMLNKEEGVWWFPPQAGPYGRSGIHDAVGFCYGLGFTVEAKADATCKMTAKQLEEKDKVEAAGGTFFLVYDKATIEAVRQWIVSTRNRRQEGTGGSVGEPTSYPRCNPDGKSCAIKADTSSDPTYIGYDNCIKELRLRDAFPDLAPILLARQVQTVQPPA